MSTRYWDSAWRDFLGPSMPWCSYFVRNLISEKYANYKVAFVANTVTQEQLSNRMATLLSCTVMHSTRTLRFEAHLTDNEPVLTLGIPDSLLNPGYRETKAGKEYILGPKMYLFDCDLNATSDEKERVIEFAINEHRTTLDFPVRSALCQIPLLQHMTDGITEDEYVTTLRRLYKESGGTDSFEMRQRFYAACQILRSPDAYNVQGVLDVELIQTISPAVRKWIKSGDVPDGAAIGVGAAQPSDIRRINLFRK